MLYTFSCHAIFPSVILLTLPSIYFFWSYHSPSKGVYDFETSGKNIQRLFDYAKQAGLWVIARAGPYCNVLLDFASCLPYIKLT
jgi:beta-galactosidase GanA